MSESLKMQFSRLWRESFKQMQEEKNVTTIAYELGVSPATLYNWCKAETANIDLDRYDQVAVYCGWDTEVDQRESVVNISDRGSNRCSDHTALYLREDSSVLVSV